jgi:hypothetical protein
VALLFVRDGRVPVGRQLIGIAWTDLGLAIGYPLFLALALKQVCRAAQPLSVSRRLPLWFLTA